MQLLAFYLGLHDSNVCALSDGRLVYRKFERLSGIKHQRAKFAAIHETCRDWGVQPEYVAFSDGNRNHLGACGANELFCEVGNLEGFEGVRSTICLDHHFAHALSGWPGFERPDSFRAVSIDGRGDHGRTSRAFRIGQGTDASVVFESGRFNVGFFFEHVGHKLGLRGKTIDLAGKVMGLQAYAEPDDDFVREHAEDPLEGLPGRLKTAPFRGKRPSETSGFYAVDNPEFLCWLASCHEILAAATARLFSSVAVSDEPIDFSGGCAQNSIFNEVLARQFPGFTVSSHPYDGGLSFGCLDLLIRILGADRPDTSGYPFLQDDENVGYADGDVQTRVADLIQQGSVVGWMQGRGEIGPRALGHRSILYDPTHASAKQILNDRVKFREPWRPFAASIPLVHAADWFDITTPSPWMQRALRVRPERRAQIPGVVHADGTCRAQTIDPTTAELDSLVGVIEHLAQKTGIPLLLNTSLNSGGEPIYGSRAQAEALLAAGRLDALCVGNEIIQP
jgi:carbamoyltransferase